MSLRNNFSLNTIWQYIGVFMQFLATYIFSIHYSINTNEVTDETSEQLLIEYNRPWKLDGRHNQNIKSWILQFVCAVIKLCDFREIADVLFASVVFLCVSTVLVAFLLVPWVDCNLWFFLIQSDSLFFIILYDKMALQVLKHGKLPYVYDVMPNTFIPEHIKNVFTV